MDEEYNLTSDEAIIMHSENVDLLSGKDREQLDELVLTNKNLILVNVVSTGLFSTQRLLKRCPLDSVVCPDGTPRAFLGKKKDDYVLQVVFEQETLTLRFPINQKREAKRWADAIRYAIAGDLDSIDTEQTHLPGDVTELVDGFKGFAAAFVSEATDVASTVSKASKSIKKTVTPKTTVQCIGCHAPLSGCKGTVLTCDYCGTKQTL